MDREFIEGLALVASPYLTDGNFRRSVVYIVKHDEEGAYGLILNRPMEVTVGKLLRHVLECDLENHQPIYNGGPVEGPVVVLHEGPAPDQSLMEPGVYLATHPEQFMAICQQTEARYRVFNGYAGWAPGQLEDELKQGGWLVWKLKLDDLFADSDEIWETAVRQIGREIIIDTIQSARVPTDPSVN